MRFRPTFRNTEARIGAHTAPWRAGPLTGALSHPLRRRCEGGGVRVVRVWGQGCRYWGGGSAELSIYFSAELPLGELAIYFLGQTPPPISAAKYIR